MSVRMVVLLYILVATHSHDAMVQSAVVHVPIGTTPTIDGVIGTLEWEDAARLPLHGAQAVFVKRAGDRLYIGIKGDSGGIASVGLATADSIRFLHASTGLITAAYVRHGEAWRLVHDFRGPAVSSGEGLRRDAPGFTEAYRSAQFAQYGWYANLVETGPATDMEYEVQIGSADSGGTYMSVVFFQVRARVQSARAPAGLADASLDRELISGTASDGLQFDPASWIALRW